MICYTTIPNTEYDDPDSVAKLGGGGGGPRTLIFYLHNCSATFQKTRNETARVRVYNAERIILTISYGICTYHLSTLSSEIDHEQRTWLLMTIQLQVQV